MHQLSLSHISIEFGFRYTWQILNSRDVLFIAKLLFTALFIYLRSSLLPSRTIKAPRTPPSVVALARNKLKVAPELQVRNAAVLGVGATVLYFLQLIPRLWRRSAKRKQMTKFMSEKNVNCWCASFSEITVRFCIHLNLLCAITIATLVNYTFVVISSQYGFTV